MKFISRNFRASMIATALMAAAVEGSAGGSAVPEVAAPTVAKVVLTRAEKQAKQLEILTKRLAADTETLAKLQLEMETGARLDGVTDGSLIVARIGRAETSKEVTARVLGVKEDENGSRRYKIAFGSGFDCDAVVIQGSQILRVVDESAPVEAEPVAEVVAAVPSGYVDPTVAVGVDAYDRPVNGNGVVIAA